MNCSICLDLYNDTLCQVNIFNHFRFFLFNLVTIYFISLISYIRVHIHFVKAVLINAKIILAPSVEKLFTIKIRIGH